MMSASRSSALGAKKKADMDAVAKEVARDSAEAWVEGPQFSAANPLHAGMKSMEEGLRCSVCQELFHIPIMLPCRHTFCSNCIQSHAKKTMKSSKRAMDCPSCRQVYEEKDKCANSQLEVVLVHYKAIRSHLLQALATPPANPQLGGGNDATMEEEQQEEDKPSRVRGGCKRAHDAMEDSSSGTTQQQPAIAVLQNIDSNQQDRPKKAKVSYHGMKKKQLQELCLKAGLPTRGTEDELKKRHENFITRYNSECDSVVPKTEKEIRKEVAKDEKQERESKKDMAPIKKLLEALVKQRVRLGKSKGGWGTTAYSGIKAFDTELKANFTMLKVGLEERCPRSREPSQDWLVHVEPLPKPTPATAGASPSNSPVNSNKENHSSAALALDSSPLLLASNNSTPNGDILNLGPNAPSTISHHCSQQSLGMSQPSAAIERMVANSKNDECASPNVEDSKPPASDARPSQVGASCLPRGSAEATCSTETSNLSEISRHTSSSRKEASNEMDQPVASAEPITTRRANKPTIAISQSPLTEPKTLTTFAEPKQPAESKVAVATNQEPPASTRAKPPTPTSSKNKPPTAPKGAQRPKRGPKQTTLPIASLKPTKRARAEAPAAGTRRSGRSNVGHWACPHCTFVNHTRKVYETCEMCLHTRHEKPTRSQKV